MTSDNRARLRVAALIFVMVNAVVFGVGLVAVLTTPIPASSLASNITDQATLDGIKKLVERMEAQKAALHPERTE